MSCPVAHSLPTVGPARPRWSQRKPLIKFAFLEMKRVGDDENREKSRNWSEQGVSPSEVLNRAIVKDRRIERWWDDSGVRDKETQYVRFRHFEGQLDVSS